MTRLAVSWLSFALVSWAGALMVPATGNWSAIRGSAQVDNSVTRTGKPSLRIEPGAGGAEARVRSAAVTLVAGKHYELKAWIKTQAMEVSDLDRTPIATGASIAMSSMPFDVHSESLSGTRDWQPVSLKFTATRSKDQIELRAAEGGQFKGRFWVDGVSLDEVSGLGDWPVKDAVDTFGPAYRYPKGGWIYVHIEGKPYERGFQHGYLLAREIEGYVDRCAAQLDPKSKRAAWNNGRATADALFLRGFDEEMREEMKGIADGAAAAKAQYDGRAIDLRDIVAANTITELGLLSPANRVTPTGLEGLRLSLPDYFNPKRDVGIGDRCSAFAATGKATRDGRMVIAHLTMWPLTLAEQTNIMLDIKPEKGHRLVMQSYPGGIQSGTDWYQNDAGVVLTETTIRQSPFNMRGTPVAFRARQAIQYGTDISQVAQHLMDRNNGLYTNEWLIADAKNDEIAMFELGTNKTRLYRSSKNEWFGGVEGFYWGCNNAKDLQVRTEYTPDPKQDPQDIPYVSSDRDRKWLQLYDTHKGQIDERFAFLALRTAPLVSASAFDGKVTTGEMASRTMLWAVLGKPNQRECEPNRWQKEQYPGNEGIYSSGYRLFAAEPDENLRASIQSREQERLARQPGDTAAAKTKWRKIEPERLWKGWIMPAADSDRWLTASGAVYHALLASEEFPRELGAWRIRYRAATRTKDWPLRQLSFDLRNSDWFEASRAKGVLLLDALRLKMGDEKFLQLMRDFYTAHTTSTASTAEFTAAAEKTLGSPLDAFFTEWLDGTGLPGSQDGPAFAPQNIFGRLESALIVYGTALDAGSNRRAAELLRRDMLNWYEHAVEIRKDFELAPEEARHHTLIFVGRPESNSALRAFAGKLPVTFDGAAFTAGGKTYASENFGIMLAAEHPDDPRQLAVVLAGNSALQTVRLATQRPHEFSWQVYRGTKAVERGY
ncbi:MAG: hypothetical protein IT161_07895 [Bryobacterales bacterium]|nr:hypothetical protein [Bryobacterales bacterium]